MRTPQLRILYIHKVCIIMHSLASNTSSNNAHLLLLTRLGECVLHSTCVQKCFTCSAPHNRSYSRSKESLPESVGYPVNFSVDGHIKAYKLRLTIIVLDPNQGNLVEKVNSANIHWMQLAIHHLQISQEAFC